MPPFSYRAASLQFNASSLAYCDPPLLHPGLTFGGLTVTASLHSSALTDIHLLVGYYASGDVQLAFRGSKSAANFALDLQAQLAALQLTRKQVEVAGCSDCKVHSGFQEGVASVLPQVKAALAEAVSLAPESSSRTLLVAGHSLGGALSSLAAFTLASSSSLSAFSRVAVTTFGAPRVGNLAFASAYNEVLPDTIRVVNGGDTVPHTPLEALGYYHEGVEVWFPRPGASKSYATCSTEAESDERCSGSLVGSATLFTPWTELNALTNLDAEDHNYRWTFAPGSKVSDCPA